MTTNEERREKHTIYCRERYRTDGSFKRKHISRVKESRERKKDILTQAKASGCMLCKEKDPRCLIVYITGIDSWRSVNLSDSKTFILDNLPKVKILCRNCAAKRRSFG